MSEVTVTGKARGSSVPREAMILAEALSKKHGIVTISRESHGLHLYMASPECLINDGPVELDKRHLSLNVDRYFGWGSWRNRVGTYDKDNSALCMKTRKPFSVPDLLRMAPLEQRGIKAPEAKVLNVAVDNENFLVDDGRGNRVPMGPGDCVPLNELDDDNPAVWYVKNRGFDPDDLVAWCGASYCVREAKEDRSIGLIWKRMPGGFKDTPQGRLIFNMWINGIYAGYQARVIDKREGDCELVWHPYKNRWVPVRVKVGGDWKLRPDFENDPFRWAPSKYKTSRGRGRVRLLMGYDPAVQANLGYCVLFEGPLDAARFGPGGIAILGKYLAEEQAQLVTSRFSKVVFMADPDAGGDDMRKSVVAHLGGRVDLYEAATPAGYSDPGDAPREVLWETVGKVI